MGAVCVAGGGAPPCSGVCAVARPVAIIVAPSMSTKSLCIHVLFTATPPPDSLPGRYPRNFPLMTNHSNSSANQALFYLEAILTGKPMKAAVARKPLIRIAVVESDPLRFVGFRALFDSEPDLELVSASLSDLGQLASIDLVLLGNRSGQNLFDIMASLKAVRPDLRIIVTGSGMDEESILKAIAAGAKGYVDEAAPQPNLCRLCA